MYEDEEEYDEENDECEGCGLTYCPGATGGFCEKEEDCGDDEYDVNSSNFKNFLPNKKGIIDAILDCARTAQLNHCQMFIDNCGEFGIVQVKESLQKVDPKVVGVSGVFVLCDKSDNTFLKRSISHDEAEYLAQQMINSFRYVGD